MKNKIIQLTIMGLALLAFSGNSFADDCDNLSNNAKWNDGMARISQLYKAEQYDQVLNLAKELYTICPKSPTLLYYMGISLENQGDKERAAIYVQKASENITEMAVAPGISRQIWYKRYELEHPNRTEESFQKLQTQVTELERKNIELSTLTSINTDSENYKALMWTGVGSAGGGVALFATGLGLIMGTKKNTEIDKQKAKIKSQYLAGWTLLGIGIGFSIIGGTVAGIAGFHYTKSNNDAVMSFQLAPDGASFEMTF